MEALIPFLANLLAGAVGGIVAGIFFSKLSLGVMGNILAGLVGGGVAGQFLADVAGAQGLEFGPMLAEVLSGGAGGAICTLIIGWIRRYVA